MFAAAAPSFLSRALQLISGVRRAQDTVFVSEESVSTQRPLDHQRDEPSGSPGAQLLRAAAGGCVGARGNDIGWWASVHRPSCRQTGALRSRLRPAAVFGQRGNGMGWWSSVPRGNIGSWFRSASLECPLGPHAWKPQDGRATRQRARFRTRGRGSGAPLRASTSVLLLAASWCVSQR